MVLMFEAAKEMGHFISWEEGSIPPALAEKEEDEEEGVSKTKDDLTDAAEAGGQEFCINCCQCNDKAVSRDFTPFNCVSAWIAIRFNHE
jgi:hypothetical protein